MVAGRLAELDWRRVLVRTVVGCELLFGVFRGAFLLGYWPGVLALAMHADHAIHMVQARRVLAGLPPYLGWKLSDPFACINLSLLVALVAPASAPYLSQWLPYSAAS